jgi:hypothetical protein
MAVYGGNSFAVMFQKTEQAEPLPFFTTTVVGTPNSIPSED